MRRIVSWIVCLCLAALFAAAPGRGSNRLDEERLINLDSPFVQGFGKVRFDFQHTWEEGTLYPIADLTVAGGIAPFADLQFEVLPHNAKVSAFNKTVNYQSMSWEWALRAQLLNQHAEDPLSLAFSAHFWRYDAKREFKDVDPATGAVLASSRFTYHWITTGAQAIASYDFGFAGPTAVLKWYRRDLAAFKQPVETLWVPGAGVWISLFSYGKILKAQAVGDYHFVTLKGAEHAWGAGLRVMYGSPHIYSFFVANNSGDLWEESIFGTNELMYSFRWSYRF